MRRVFATSLALLTFGLALAGCAEEDKANDEVRAALRSTAKLAKTFAYDEQIRGEKTEINGLVEDDYRYKVRVSINGVDAYDEVASDDALAVRSLEPSALSTFLAPEVKAGLQIGDGVVPAELLQNAEIAKAVESLKALQSRRWVLDPTGAPSLAPGGQEKRLLGEDVVYDALTLFRQVEALVGGKGSVTLFNRESVTYKEKEDPFPKPSLKSGVKRYDFAQAQLPTKADAQAVGASQAIPSEAHFRKTAVYVKDGRVIEIRQLLDINNKLKDLKKIYDIKVPAGTTDQKLEEVLVDAINSIRAAKGDDPMRDRSLVATFGDFGDPIKVSLPTDTIAGDLSVLRNRGRLAVVRGQRGSSGSDGSTSESPTTTTAPAQSEGESAQPSEG